MASGKKRKKGRRKKAVGEGGRGDGGLLLPICFGIGWNKIPADPCKDLINKQKVMA